MSRIVIIEDNPMNMKLICNVLRKHAYEIFEATNAEQGLALIREQQPDLILMDIQLPGMDGLQASRILKADKALASIPIIALTALAMSGDKEQILAAGCDDYLTKPIRYQEVLEKVSEHLSCA